jgi:hypothetical protein
MRRLVGAMAVLVAIATFGVGGSAEAASSSTPALRATTSNAIGARIGSGSQWTLNIPDWLSTGCTVITFEGRQFFDDLGDAGTWTQRSSSVSLVVTTAGAPTPHALGRGRYGGKFHKKTDDYTGKFRGQHGGEAPGTLNPGANPDCGP